MKKIIAALLVLAVAAPAFAVDVTATQISGTEVQIKYDASGESELVRAFGIDVTMDSPDVNINDYNNDTGAAYNIFPGSISISGTGVITGYGTPIANPEDHPDTQPGPNAVTIELGSLYASGDPAPAVDGNLVVLVMDVNLVTNEGLTSTLTMANNAARGGIVLEDGSAGSNYGDPDVIFSTLTRAEYDNWLWWAQNGTNPGVSPQNWRNWCWKCGDVSIPGDGYVSAQDVLDIYGYYSDLVTNDGRGDFNMDKYESAQDVLDVYSLYSALQGCAPCVP